MRTPSWKGMGGEFIVMLFLVASVGVQGQGTPTPTPVPETGMPLVLSFVIDGVVYTVRCNFSGVNASNCSFVADHGLIVSRLPLTGSSSVPQHIEAVIWTLVGLVTVLLILMVVAWVIYCRSGRAAGYQEVPTGPPPGYQDGPPGYRPVYSYSKNTGGGQLPVIGVELVRPSLP
jgi:hypothetical protein